MKQYDGDTGMRLTDCCAAASTFHDGTLCCKNCWKSVEVGEGDGNEYLDGKWPASTPAYEALQRAVIARDLAEMRAAKPAPITKEVAALRAALLGYQQAVEMLGKRGKRVPAVLLGCYDAASHALKVGV